MDRKLTFGKYKCQAYKKIIITHIGYIMWCLENLSWFHLTDEEQEIYDGVAIAIKKSNEDTTFPKDLLFKHIKDKNSLETLSTPFRIRRGVIQIDKNSEMYEKVKNYQEIVGSSLNVDILSQIAKLMDDFDTDCEFGFDDEEPGIYCASDM